MRIATLRPPVLLSVLVLGAALQAAPPPGYYAAAEGKIGEELRLALSEIISGHSRVSYSWEPFFTLDEDPENADNVILIYSGFSKPKLPTNTYWNREHIWPRSRGLGSSGTAHDDLFNLVPVNPGVNSARGNLAFGYPDPDHPNYVGPGYYAEAPLASRDSLRWLPPEFDRGFLARAVFYMATRYRGEGTEPSLYLTDDPPAGTPWGSEMGELSVLLEWNRGHLPDEAELRRNDLIFGQFQHNRNPYIDYPDLVDAVWTSDLYLAPGSWRVESFTFAELDDPSVSGWGADPDRDRLTNLVEYAFGLDPRSADVPQPVAASRETLNGSPVLTLTFNEVRDA